jgi:ribosomal-protein-alanine N-acetyltransferase
MSAQLRPRAELRAMSARDLDQVLAVEDSAYAFPWTRGNFIDSLAAGYAAEMLLDEARALIGYYVAMPGVGEMHLLNLTVAPPWQRRGYAVVLLDALDAHCRRCGIRQLWLEVRVSNSRARQVYERRGFAPVGLRRGYYPAGPAKREDAVVMRLELEESDDLD